MGQVHVQVVLSNYRETVMARLGHLPVSDVHRIEIEALVDTGAMRSVLPPAVADELGLLRLGRTVARYADGRLEEVDTTEGFYIALLGRSIGFHIPQPFTARETIIPSSGSGRSRAMSSTWATT